MREYKTVEEIREEAKQGAINHYRKLANMFNNHPSMELSSMMSDRPLELHKLWGLSWEQIEALEY